jgi:hypothetical protein
MSVPNIFQWVGPGGAAQVYGAIALVRTSSPNPDGTVGGTFGVGYPAVVAANRAKHEAWLFSLVKDGQSRTNLAIADARSGAPEKVGYFVDLYDADAGGNRVSKTLGPISLAGGQWYQLSDLLSGTGISHGYARVYTSGGASDFVTYAVVNDGAAVGQGTSDGSYVPMSYVQ